MNFHYPDQDVHLKFRLKKHIVGSIYDFKYNFIYDTKKNKDPKEMSPEMLMIYNTNHGELRNMLGIDLTMHDLKILIESIEDNKKVEPGQPNQQTSTKLLQAKWNRLSIFYNSLIQYIFELTHMLYYTVFINDTDKAKSGKTFLQCLEIAIDIGMDIRRKYEKVFQEEFNASPAIAQYIKSVKDAI